VALRLVVRRDGATLDAEIGPEVEVATSPFAPVHWRRSGDGHFLFIVPQDFWPPAGVIELHVRGRWTATRGVPGGISISGDIDQTISVSVAPAGSSLRLDPDSEAPTALQLQRLSVALPSFAPSVNQIGFDSYDWLVGTVLLEPAADQAGALVLFVRGARFDEDGIVQADPSSPFAFSLHGRYERDSVSVVARGVDLPFSFGDVPMDRFELRFQLGEDLRALPGASMYGEVICADVPFYGPLLVDFTRLADDEGRMAASGTFLLGPADPRSPSTKRPAGMQLLECRLDRPALDGSPTVRVVVSGLAQDGEISVILLDPVSRDALAVPRVLDSVSDPGTDTTTILFDVDPTTALPAAAEAIVIAGVFALGRVPV
jgi:hypothetical protein